MAFDDTKNYAEFGNAFFRGRLKGAKGEARFKLQADVISAVDTINIAGQAVTYTITARYGPGAGLGSQVATSGGILFQTAVDIVDANVYIEFIAFGVGAAYFYVDGSRRPLYSGRRPGDRCIPHNEVMKLAPGVHTMFLYASPGTVSSEGFIICRYIRPTGSAEL